MTSDHTSPQRLDSATCSFCGERSRVVGRLVEGHGANGSGGVFIWRECAELVLKIIAEERRRRGFSDDDSQKVTIRKPCLAQLQELVSQSVAEHNGVLPKGSALVLFGRFATLLAWELLSLEDFNTLMNLLPDYPEDVVVQRMLHR